MGMKVMMNANKIGKINEPIRTLRKIQRICPNAIIAGGYHRDMYTGVDYNDIDIYIELGNNLSVGSKDFWKTYFELKVDDFRSMDGIRELSETDEEYDVPNNNNIITVYEMVKNELKYNLIIINNSPIDYVEEFFDFGICKTYCDGKKISFTKDFISDVENKTLTLTARKLSVANFNHVMSVHFEKLKHKYPNHKLIVPERHIEAYKQFQTYTS
jgi:hypothetical protein